MSLLADWWWVVMVPIVGWGIHALASMLEDRGLIYYRRPPVKGVATAMMNYQQLFEPAVEHVIEYHKSGDLTVQTNGEPEPAETHPAASDRADRGHLAATDRADTDQK